MSISASLAGLIVYFVSKIRQIPRRIICVLWIVPFLRMWIPVGINSKYSLMSFISKFATRTVTVYEGTVDLSMINSVMAADTYFPMTYKIDLFERVFGIAFAIWGIIAVALIITMVILYSVTMAEIRGAKHFDGNVYISDRVSSPATYGIFRPRIVLPKEYDEEDLKYILMHEKSHIKRLDNLRRVAAITAACVHWFNPLSWLFLENYLTSLELACDESVLRQCNDGERKAYAEILLDCAERKSLYVSAFGGTAVRVRIERILAYKKLSAISMTAFIILAAVLGYILLTNAK